MWLTVNKIYQQVNLINAYIYYLHYPELIRIGYKFIGKRKKVILNIRADIIARISSKFYFNLCYAQIIYCQCIKKFK
jgi:hypothetical protein